MKFSNPQRSNPNVLFNEFKGIGDFTQDDYLLLNYKKKFTNPKYNIPKLAIGSDALHLKSEQNEDDFNIILENEIELAMRPITSPYTKAQNIEKLLREQEIKKKNTHLTKRTNEHIKTSRLVSENGDHIASPIMNDPNERDSGTLQYSSIYLPPINVDPFTSSKATKHWRYQQPVKYNAVTSRSASNNVSTISENFQRNLLEQQISKEKQTQFTKHTKSHSHGKYSTLHTTRSLGHCYFPTTNLKKHQDDFPDIKKKFSLIKQPNEDELMTSTILKQLNDPKITSSVSIIKSKNINNLKVATEQINHLLNSNHDTEKLDQLDKTLLDLNQAKSQTILTDANKRILEIPHSYEDSYNGRETFNGSQTSINTHKDGTHKEKNLLSPKSIKKTPIIAQPQKKEYYNKWYVPVKFWNLKKETNSIKKKYENLKKDINHFYNNMHGYTKQNPLDAQTYVNKKDPQQVAHKTLQDKLKQNNSIRKYKKELIENRMRIPTCLNEIEEENIT